MGLEYRVEDGCSRLVKYKLLDSYSSSYIHFHISTEHFKLSF